MSVHAVADLRTHFGTEIPAALWSAPDPRTNPTFHGNAVDLTDDECRAVQILAAPDARIEGRATGELEVKFCLARQAGMTARVVRTAGTATVDVPHCDGSAPRLAQLVSPVVGAAGAAPAAVSASFDAAAGLAALRESSDRSEIAAELRRSGVDPDAARLLARAFATTTRSVEFTFYASARRLAPVVAVMDTAIGRVVALTASGGAAAPWTSTAEGTAHRVGKALRRACEELPGGGWIP